MANPKILIVNAGLNAEEFDGEIVLLDVLRGLYFSLSGSAIELWRAFGEGRSVDKVIDALCRQLAGADRAALESATQSMCDHGLLVPGEEAPGGDQLVAVAAAFIPPLVEAFSDLADLISIDPVHEVDATTGWPVKQGNFPDVH